MGQMRALGTRSLAATVVVAIAVAILPLGGELAVQATGAAGGADGRHDGRPRHAPHRVRCRAPGSARCARRSPWRTRSTGGTITIPAGNYVLNGGSGADTGDLDLTQEHHARRCRCDRGSNGHEDRRLERSRLRRLGCRREGDDAGSADLGRQCLHRLRRRYPSRYRSDAHADREHRQWKHGQGRQWNTQLGNGDDRQVHHLDQHHVGKGRWPVQRRHRDDPQLDDFRQHRQGRRRHRQQRDRDDHACERSPATTPPTRTAAGSSESAERSR